MVMRKFFILLLAVFLTNSYVHAGEKKGGIVIAFDDGYPSWITIIAPELSSVGGLATGFVNNQRIKFGDISFDDLLLLQNKYGWEIGTHTYHHYNAPEYVQQKGLSSWIKNELEASVTELQAHGLKIYSVVFPYNAFTKELAVEVLKRHTTFRHDDVYPIADSIGKDGSLPGTEFDIGFYVPIEHVFKWIDFAQKQDAFLFLYAHKVLPDEEFSTGIVTSLSTQTLFADKDISLPSKRDLCLVPDTRMRVYKAIKVESVSGNVVKVFQGDLSRMSRTGATFIVGPCYGMQRSYFRRIIEYAAERLSFYTVNEVLVKMQKQSKKEL